MARYSTASCHGFRHFAGGLPTQILIERTPHWRRVQNRELQASFRKLFICQVHQSFSQALLAKLFFYIHIEHVSSLVLRRMRRMWRPVDRHQSNAAHDFIAFDQKETKIALVQQARLEPYLE